MNKKICENCGPEIVTYVEEVVAAIEGLYSNSAPSPEELIFYLMVKNRGEGMARGLLYIFSKGLDKRFKLDQKECLLSLVKQTTM